MSVLSQTDADEYMATAVPMAVGGVSETLARHVGSLIGHDVWSDADGHWLRVRGSLDAYPDTEIQYARVILGPSGPDMGAEGEATIFSSGFEERLHTRLHRTEPVDGVITL